MKPVDSTLKPIDDLNSNPKIGKANDLIFGFSPLNASFLSGLCIAFIVITFLLINPNFTYQKTSQSKIANNGLSNNLTTSRSPNKVIDSDLADVEEDTSKTEINKQDRKDLSNKIQLVND